MLGQRILTAVVLVALLLPALLVSSAWPFAALTLLLIAAAGWEWARLNQIDGLAAVLSGATLALLCAGAWWLGWTERAPAIVWSLAAAAWLVGGALALRGGPAMWPRLPWWGAYRW